MVRKTAFLDDPWLREAALALPVVTLQAYMVALAAWQRGLTVTFHYEVATKSARFAQLPVQGFRGELFSVSDGVRTHYFRRTQGDLTSMSASRLVENKEATKRVLQKVGIAVPEGTLVGRAGAHVARAFMRRFPRRTFLLKPLAGTLGQGVLRGLRPAEVLQQLPRLANARYLLEAMIPGQEYRTYAVDGRFVAAVARVPAHVVGDGIHTIDTLVDKKNQLRAIHPLYQDGPINKDAALPYLARQGMMLDTVPERGHRVMLNHVPSTTYGGDFLDATDTVPAEIKDATIKAQQALGLPFTGIDIIAEPQGASLRGVVLEANQCPYGSSSWLPLAPSTPSSGNVIADALIDYYFPNARYLSHLSGASFDMQRVCQILRLGTVGSLTLPVLSAEWVHQRLLIDQSEHATDQKVAVAVRTAQYQLGIHVRQRTTASGALWLDIVAPRARYEAFAKAVGGGAKCRWLWPQRWLNNRRGVMARN